ncbi:hypothetical protein FACS189483_00860 [Spirochaetia bacterium]|nr:hypothetical protein FACS189483_00860 [Spirochaetia bacterium]
MDTNTILELRDFTVEFSTPAGRFTAVNSASFKVQRGEVLAIVGESGSGKSVMTQSIVKLIPSPPSRIARGAVMFEGQDLVRFSPAELHRIRGRKIGIIFQDAMTALNPTMRIGSQITESLLEHFRFTKKNRIALTEILLEKLAGISGGVSAGQDMEKREGIITAWFNEFFYPEQEQLSQWRQDILSLLDSPKRDAGIRDWIAAKGSMTRTKANAIALRLLELVKIPEPHKRFNQYIFQLSGGMRQRIMVAIAMACRPGLIIADEPTTALDVTIKGEILDLLIDLKQKLNVAVLLITHDLGIVASYADRIGVLYTGEFAEMGTVDDVFYNPRHPYTLGLLHSIPRLDIDSDKELETIEGNPPNPLEHLEGCSFADRCRYAMRICYTRRPPRADISETHWAACFLLDGRAAQAAVKSGYQEALR